MINVNNIKPDSRLQKYIKKISCFSSNDVVKYKHKLTQSAYTILTYNSNDVPVLTIADKSIKPECRLQVAGPKVLKDIWVEYDGFLNQILVEFTAAGFYYLFHKSPQDFANKLTDLHQIISQNQFKSLEGNLQREENIIEQVKIIECFLLELSFKALPFVDYIDDGIGMIEQKRGNIIIQTMVDKLGISKRQFDRKFQEMVGVTPKYYSKIVQLYYVLNIICSKRYSSIQDLAHRGEFYDLPHFVNTFKRLTGYSPNEFINSDKHIALKYFREN